MNFFRYNVRKKWLNQQSLKVQTFLYVYIIEQKTYCKVLPSLRKTTQGSHALWSGHIGMSS